MLRSRRAGALVLALALLALASPAAAATDGPAFGLRPVRYDPDRPATRSYFIYDAAPGQVIHDEVEVTNVGSSRGDARLYVVDGATGPTSGAVFLGENDPRRDVGSWLSLDQPAVSLDPGESRTVGFTLQVPADARPGQHLGGIVALNTAVKPGSQAGALQLNLRTRTVVAVQVNLPGPVVEHVAVTGLSATTKGGVQTLLLGLRNDGTQMVKPRGALTLTDSHGQVVAQVPLTLDTFVPRTAIQYPVPLTRPLAPGAYRASIRLTYGQAGVTEYEGPLTVTAGQPAAVPGSSAAPAGVAAEPPAPSDVPVWLLGALAGAGVVLGLGLAGVAVAIRRRARRRTLTRPGGTDAPAARRVAAPATTSRRATAPAPLPPLRALRTGSNRQHHR